MRRVRHFRDGCAKAAPHHNNQSYALVRAGVHGAIRSALTRAHGRTVMDTATPDTATRAAAPSHTSRVMTLLLACALVLASLAAAPPAHAATTPTAATPAATSAKLSGKGYDQSDPISLEAGHYEVIFTYKNNVDPAHERYMAANLYNGERAVWIVDEFAEAHTVRRVVLLRKGETHLSVMASDNAEWTASLKKLTPPTKPKSALAVEGTGTGSGTLFLLKEGTYELTAAWSNNNGTVTSERRSTSDVLTASPTTWLTSKRPQARRTTTSTSGKTASTGSTWTLTRPPTGRS